MKLTRRTFLKFLGLAVVPVAALAARKQDTDGIVLTSREHPVYDIEKRATSFICRATGGRLYIPDEMFMEVAGTSMQPHQTIEEYLKEKRSHEKRQLSSDLIKSMYEQINYGGSTLDEKSNRIANKALARSLRQTQEIHLSNIINRKA